MNFDYNEEQQLLAASVKRFIDKDYTFELTGTGSKLDAFLKAIDSSAILETVRTGASGIGRGDRVLKV